MDMFKKIKGTIESLFHIGGPSGSAIKNNSGVIEARNSADSAYAKLRALEIQTSPGINDIPTLLDIMAKVIQFSFDGASAPAAGTNTGKFGFCHTTGGSYTNNDVVYDDGSNLRKLPRESCKLIVTTDAVSGTVSLNQNGIYGWSGSAYVLKGDGASTNTGIVKSIRVDYDYTDGNVDSTEEIPSGADVLCVTNSVTTALDGTAPTVGVSVNGSTPLTILATTVSNVKVSAQYESDEKIHVEAANTGVVRVAVTPDSSANGAGFVEVIYTSPGA
jgi:hypothetical protein